MDWLWSRIVEATWERTSSFDADDELDAAGSTPDALGVVVGMRSGSFSESGKAWPSTSVTTGRGMASCALGVKYMLRNSEVGNALGAVYTGDPWP